MDENASVKVEGGKGRYLYIVKTIFTQVWYIKGFIIFFMMGTHRHGRGCFCGIGGLVICLIAVFNKTSGIHHPSRQLTVHWQPTIVKFHCNSDFHLPQSQNCLLGRWPYPYSGPLTTGLPGKSILVDKFNFSKWYLINPRLPHFVSVYIETNFKQRFCR